MRCDEIHVLVLWIISFISVLVALFFEIHLVHVYKYKSMDSYPKPDWYSFLRCFRLVVLVQQKLFMQISSSMYRYLCLIFLWWKLMTPYNLVCLCRMEPIKSLRPLDRWPTCSFSFVLQKTYDNFTGLRR